MVGLPGLGPTLQDHFNAVAALLGATSPRITRSSNRQPKPVSFVTKHSSLFAFLSSRFDEFTLKTADAPTFVISDLDLDPGIYAINCARMMLLDKGQWQALVNFTDVDKSKLDWVDWVPYRVFKLERNVVH